MGSWDLIISFRFSMAIDTPDLYASSTVRTRLLLQRHQHSIPVQEGYDIIDRALLGRRFITSIYGKIFHFVSRSLLETKPVLDSHSRSVPNLLFGSASLSWRRTYQAEPYHMW